MSINRSKKKILVVEDEAGHAILIQRAFKSSDIEYSVSVCNGINSAREQMQQSLPDLVLSDLKLPDGRGSELITFNGEKKYPVIIMTSYGDENIAVEVMKAGAIDYIIKSESNFKTMPRIVAQALREWDYMLAHQQDQKALQESESKFRTLIENTNSIPWKMDLENGRFTYMGEQIEKVLGYPADSWKDMDVWADRIHPDDRQQAVQFCKSQTQKGIDHTFEYRCLSAEGEIVWLRDTVTVIRENNIAKELAGFMFDITEIKKTEQVKQKLEEQLLQSQKMEAIGTLAGGIAHDFNNILGIIIGYTELAKDNIPAQGVAHEYLSQVLAGANRAKEVVSGILAFSRKDEKAQKPIELSTIINDVIALVRHSIPSTIEIHTNIKKKLSPVVANSTQIHQIIMNLCANASHAMREKGGTLKIQLDQVKIGFGEAKDKFIPPGEYLKLLISDNGCGMEPEIKTRIFEPYFTTKHTGEGTGMGLAVVHGIVKSHNGWITVSSEPGQGTQFDIYFPVSDTRAIPEEEKEIDGQELKGSERILLVDDEPKLISVVKVSLEELGYQVTAKTSSVKALNTFRENPADFDLLITDMTMPNITGIQLVEKIREISPDLPVILCTGYDETVSGENYQNFNLNGFITKPVKKGELALLIRNILS